MNILDSVAQDYLKEDVPAFNVGDTVRVHVKIKEGNRERIQNFEGFVLKIQNGGIAKTFTVRRIASGVGVEKTFPIHSPWVEKIDVIRRGKVRRARLNYMRGRTGKAAKIKTRDYSKREGRHSAGACLPFGFLCREKAAAFEGGKTWKKEP